MSLTIIRAIIFLVAYTALFLLCWFATKLITSKFFGKKLSNFSILSIAFPAAGVIGWIIFTIYFYISINY